MNEVPIQNLAKWFLTKESMTHKKLQKICYYGVAWGWALMNRNIVTDDRFEAWVHGPAAPGIYEIYKDSGWNAIPMINQFEAPRVSNALADLLESVWLTYGDKSGNELEALSHSEKPWIEARAGLQPSDRSNNPISTATMREFYNSIRTTEI